MVRQLAPGDLHGELRRLLANIASKADARMSGGRGTAGNGAAERRPTDPRRRCPAPAPLP